MRWLKLALPVVLLSTGAALSILLFVVPDRALSERSQESAGRAQYEDEGHSGQVESPRGPPPAGVESPETDYADDYTRRLARENDALEVESSSSEGTLSGARAPAEELSIMEPPAPYSQVVDHATPGGIPEPGWSRGPGQAQ